MMLFTRNNHKGKFIVIEGIDGSGLSTQTALVTENLTKMGFNSFKTKEPTDGPVGSIIRLALTHRIEITSETFALLFAADRTDHLEKNVLPKLSQGINVVCDRYFFSNLAYQGVDNNVDWLIEINKKCLLPDLTVFLDVKPEECTKRIAPRMRQEYFEELNMLKGIRAKFLEILDLFKENYDANIITVNGNNPIEKVNDDIMSHALKLLE